MQTTLPWLWFSLSVFRSFVFVKKVVVVVIVLIQKEKKIIGIFNLY